mmetsp:Transcript_25298/g.88275  ORF Transcript_25298/g.88275 Transcript_25298/m.88275 type:complete len:90 (-) Transcript_25298:642-911(-)
MWPASRTRLGSRRRHPRRQHNNKQNAQSSVAVAANATGTPLTQLASADIYEAGIDQCTVVVTRLDVSADRSITNITQATSVPPEELSSW